MKLAGLTPVAAIAEIVEDSGEMMRLPGLLKLGEREGVPVITIEELIRFMEERRCESDPQAVVEIPEWERVSFEVETTVPTVHGDFAVRAYRDRSTGADHVAFVRGPLAEGALVRVHSECLTGEAFGSLKCECGPQLDAALERVQEEGGVVVYLRGHEGRASASSTSCAPTACRSRDSTPSTRTWLWACPPTPATTARPRPSCATSACTAVRLLSNNLEKQRQLEERGLEVSELVPLIVGVGADNERYLDTKRDRMGHSLDRRTPCWIRHCWPDGRKQVERRGFTPSWRPTAAA